MIAVVIPVMVPIAVMAACPRIFQVTTAALRLSAVLTMFAFRLVQLVLRTTNLVLAPSVIIMIPVERPRWNRPSQERQNHKRGNKCFGFLQHASLLSLLVHPTLGCTCIAMQPA